MGQANKMIKNFCNFIFFALFIFSSGIKGQKNPADTFQIKKYITVHFLYGSKPAKKFRKVEDKWFGGKLGGHVGIEVETDKIFNFNPQGSFHVFTRKKKQNRHSVFKYYTRKSFYSIFGGAPDSMKQLYVTIPISEKQSFILDSLQKVYTTQTPYDYAFFGYRCGAAAYDVLAQIGVVKKFRKKKTYRKIFYPKKLRKRLLRKAKKNHWQIKLKEGTRRRVWERD
jgi:hypothetical protein